MSTDRPILAFETHDRGFITEAKLTPSGMIFITESSPNTPNVDSVLISPKFLAEMYNAWSATKNTRELLSAAEVQMWDEKQALGG